MKNKFNEKNFIIVIFLGSLFIRILYLLLNIQHVYNDILVNPDSYNYYTIAKNLISGLGFSISPPHLTSFVEPGYPIFLSFIYLIFGESFVSVILFQILLDSVTAVLIYFFTKKIINIEIAILSSIIYIIYPDFIFASCEIMTETLSLFIQAIILLTMIKAENNKRNVLYIFLGIMCALATLTRGTFILFLFLLFFYFLLRKNLIKYLIFIFFFFVSLSPWIIRNYIVHKNFIVLGTRTGLSYFTSNNEKAGGSWLKDEKLLYEMLSRKLNKDTTEAEMNVLCFKEGFKYLKSLSFKELLILETKKFLYLWDFRNYGVMWWYIILLPFAIIGIIINFIKFDKNSILYYILLTPIIVTLIFCGDVRFRMPLLPYLNIFSAIGINYLFKKHFNSSENKP